MPQPQPRQQSRLNDIQMLQRQIMFKQLQELQRQQQFQGSGDARQHNYINQQSVINKQVSGDQFSHPIDGTPIHDASQMFMVGNINLVRHGASQVSQGFSNGMVFPQAQSHALRSMVGVSQQLDTSLYGTPIATAGNNLGQFSHIQGASHDSANVFGKGNNNQTEKPIMQSSTYSNPLRSNQFDASSDQASMQGEDFLSRQMFPEKNLFGQAPTQGSKNELLAGNFQQLSTLQRDTSAMELGGRHEQAGWPGLFPDKMPNSSPSQGLSSLDPLEQKILFNMDDTSWESSLGRRNNNGTGDFGNTVENTDHMSAFPSVQSGSWSALMQSAVAEASSSDNGMQEEWSGLSFQNPDFSTDNQPSNFVDCGKQNSNWVENNLQSASSLSSKPDLQHNNSNTSSSFPGFQQSGIQFSMERKEGMSLNSSHESLQQSPRNSSKWLDRNPQQKQTMLGSQSVQRPPVPSGWPVHNYEHSESDARQQSMSSYTNRNQPCDNLAGDISGASYRDSNNLLKADNNHVGGCFPNLVSGQQVDSGNLTASHRASNFGLNTENANNKKDDTSSQGLTSHELTYAEQFKFSGNVSNSHMGLEKGQLREIRRNLTEEVPPRNNVGSNISALFDRASSYHGPNVTAQTSQNMLELLHKVDNSKENRLGVHFGSADSTPFSVVTQSENPNVSASQPYNNPSASQCFGLRLAPPSQGLPNSNCFDSSQSSPNAGNSCETVPLDSPHLRNQLQNQNQLNASVADQSKQATLPGIESSSDTSRLNCSNPYGQLPILEANPFTGPFVMSDMSQQAGFSAMLPNVWTNVSPQNLSGTEPSKVPSSLLPSPNSTNSSLETAKAIPQELQSQNYLGVENETGAYSMSSRGFGLGGQQPGKERSSQQILSEALYPVTQSGNLSYDKSLPESNALASGSLMKTSHQQGLGWAQHSDNQPRKISDLEVFGRSLKPSHVSSQNHSLQHQVHSVKNVESNLSNKVLAKHNGVHSDLNDLQVTANSGQQLFEHIPVVQNLVNNELKSMPQVNLLPTGENKTQHSWFNQYGTLKNGQMLPMYEATAAKNATHQFHLGKPFENLHSPMMLQADSTCVSQESSIWPSTATTSLAVKHLSTPFMIPPYVTAQNLAILRPKKRKSASLELLSWHKEVAQGPKRLLHISFSDLGWAQATNRLIEKVDDEAANIDDTLPMLRPKKRLMLTTQLMQQLFRPAPAVILSGDATSNCDSVTYFTARLALGDACCLRNNSHMPFDMPDVSSEKPKITERIGDQDSMKVVEDFINQAKKLEANLLRLDKSTSFSDTRVESQELEKFSVINRFVKFHSKGQAGAAEASTSTGTMRASPQRYVIAVPMPRTVPEGAQCLSL